jgi:hypothetical protein
MTCPTSRQVDQWTEESLCQEMKMGEMEPKNVLQDNEKKRGT